MIILCYLEIHKWLIDFSKAPWIYLKCARCGRRIEVKNEIKT